MPRTVKKTPSKKTEKRAVRPRKDSAFPIAAIGASAGGLEAMTQLLTALPGKVHMSLVLVQHLDPSHESAMAALLARATKMPVVEAKNGMPVEAAHVYVIPPNKIMGIAKGKLLLSPRNPKDPYLPIDHFMESLATEEGNRSIGVILSGSGGSDGVQGLYAIKTSGGITFAQDEKSAEYPRMPQATVASGCVDFVLPPEKMAKELVRLAQHPYATFSEVETEGAPPSDEHAFEEILSIIRRLAGVDFSQYKRGTLHRRIHRRMALQKLDTFKDYATYLRSHSNEVRELFTDVLIHVTGFFRDPAVFQTLKKRIFPRLVKNRQTDDTLRIWVTGCSTGEEVFSIAISLVEFLAEKDLNFPIQIFGTDINDVALDKARAGFYPESIKNDVSPERLRRFFMKSDGGYRINKAIREMCVFARQNLATDPPFSNLDLISCRNVLIYFGASLQRKVLPIFHYALKSTGYLLLGTSESIGAQADLFSLVDSKAKIYSKKASIARPAVTFAPPLELPETPRLAELSRPVPEAAAPNLGEIEKYADRLVLTQYSYPGVVINRNFEVVSRENGAVPRTRPR